MEKQKILFLYPDPPGFSGQRNAAEMVLSSFESHPKFACIPIKLPGFPKIGGGFFTYTGVLFRTLVSLLRIAAASLFGQIDGVFIALSQTRKTLTRESWIIRMVKFLSRNKQLKISYRLDSSVFTSWEGTEPVALQFREMIKRADFVSALGPVQLKVLTEKYATSTTRIEIVPNTCELKCISADLLSKKHMTEPLTVLHLGSLMEVKGYDQIVESLLFIDEAVDVTLCGKLTTNEYVSKFSSVKSQRDNLEKQLQIHQNLHWVEGAVGVAKEKLFDVAQVFVLPTFYPVEAQPLVLLEAMARGCTIVTTGIGEIPYMANNHNSIVLDDPEPRTIAAAVTKLARNSELRQKLARNALQTYTDKFSLSKFEQSWQDIFSEVYSLD